MDSYKDIIQQFDIISFDLFDTLFYRKCLQPQDVFSFVRGGQFKYSRVTMERKARRDNPDKKEVTFDDIYKTISRPEYLKSMEKQIEKDLIYINKDIEEVLNYANSIGKVIVLTSDMYLDRDFLEDILSDNNIYYDKLFLSSDLQATKWSGDLYKLVKEDYPDKKILHFDDRKDLCLRAEECGISAVQLPLLRDSKKVAYLADKHDNKDYSVYSALVSQNKSKDFWYNIGYEYVGLTSLALIDMALKNKQDAILFLARDMNIPYRIYNDIRKESDPKGVYFATNRWLQRCYPILEYTKFEDENYQSLISYFGGLNIHDTDALAKYIGIDNKICNKLLKQTWVVDGSDNKNNNLRKFMQMHFNEIREYCLSIGNDYEEYLKQYRDINCTALDLGWQGSALKFFDDANISVKSLDLFCALVDLPRINSFYKRDESLGSFWSYFSINILENIFIAPHESYKKVTTYTNNTDSIVKNYENTLYENICNPHLENYEKIYEGARDFVKDFRSIQEKYKIEISFELIRDIYARLFNNPTLEEADILGSIKHYNGTESTYIAKPSELAVLNPKVLEIELKNTTWYQGYVKILKDKHSISIDNNTRIDYTSYTDKINEFVKLNMGKTIICLGAGGFAEHLLEHTNLKDLRIIFLDNFRTEPLCGKQVLSLEKFKSFKFNLYDGCIWTMLQTDAELEEQYKELNPTSIFN